MNFFGSQFQTRKVMTAFMNFFSGVAVQKYKTDATSGIIPHKFIRVPIQWASTEKWLQVMRSQTGRKGFSPEILERNPVEVQWQLPRMSVNLVGMNYDSSRHLIKTNTIKDYLYTESPSGKYKNVYAPVPYTLDVELGVIARNIDECLQIVEQILPFFTPSLSLDVKIFDDRPSESIPIILSSVSPENVDEMMETDERIFTFTLSFNVKMNYYLPRKISSGSIRQINTNIFTTTDTEEASYSEFNQFLQVAKNPDPYGTGDYNDRSDTSLNPVYKLHDSYTGLGTLNEATGKEFQVGDVVIYNNMRLRYTGDSKGLWIVDSDGSIYSNDNNIIISTPTTADTWTL